MKFIVSILISVYGFLAPAALADLVPPAHSFHCDQWKNGKCTEGRLTRLSHALKNQANDSMSIADRSTTCDRVCEEACPKCNYCDFCPFCSIYDDAACHNVPYFENRETCSISKTDSCCKLCEVQCHSSEGACGSKGYCRNTAENTATDILTHCIEQTTNEQCMPCER